MKTTKIYANLALVCVLMMGMGFPGVVEDEKTASGNRKSRVVRYAKVGFVACTRQATQEETPRNSPALKCSKDSKEAGEPASEVSSKLGNSVEVVSLRIRNWVSR
ncbi:MAG: hypothetical protein MUD08_07065 [Cytophagales bacterium]|jgi:hypothetical protein|nr:hypothetical protein [Cytophagales bacterium]